MSVQDTINTAQLKAATMSLANLTALQNGALSVDWFPVIKGTRGILCVQNQVNIGDESSKNFLMAYACLSAFVGQFAPGAIDPNAQNPNTIIVPGGGGGSTITTNIIPFTGQTTIALNPYSTYYPTYGANPYVLIFVSDGAGGFTPDYTTSPDYVYNTPGDPTSGIVSITWGYALPTTGYVLISGSKP